MERNKNRIMVNIMNTIEPSGTINVATLMKDVGHNVLKTSKEGRIPCDNLELINVVKKLKDKHYSSKRLNDTKTKETPAAEEESFAVETVWLVVQDPCTGKMNTYSICREQDLLVERLCIST